MPLLNLGMKGSYRARMPTVLDVEEALPLNRLCLFFPCNQQLPRSVTVTLYCWYGTTSEVNFRDNFQAIITKRAFPIPYTIIFGTFLGVLKALFSTLLGVKTKVSDEHSRPLQMRVPLLPFLPPPIPESLCTETPAGLPGFPVLRRIRPLSLISPLVLRQDWAARVRGGDLTCYSDLCIR